ncbi:MAG TPA: LPS export ABC transporter permease LptG [Allosphingosinicella sp.]|jgi:lipopolysaccharide export system permease protein
MISLNFFPSRRLAWYLARSFLKSGLGVLCGLVVVLMMLDLLGESGEILAQPGNGEAELWRYVGLRIPQLIQRFLPFALLLGTLVTLASMNQNSEIISMKAAGISAHQIIAPLIATSLLIAAANFWFNERIVTRSTAALNAWEDVKYGNVPPATGTQTNIWIREGDDLIFARQVSGEGPETRLQGVTIYDRSGGTLTGILNAESGRYANPGWELTGTRRFDVDAGTMVEAPRLRVAESVDPIQFTLAAVDPNEQDFWQLRRSIDELERAGRSIRSAESNWWHKLSGPLSSMLMPLLAAIAAFGLARSGQLFLRAVTGMGLGFSYFIADNFALAMGNFGAYPPTLAAWGPFFLFLLIGETVLLRTEE